MTWEPSARLLTIEEAGRSVGRPASTIRRWHAEKRIAPTAWLGRSPLFLESHILECDAATVRRGHGVSVRSGTIKAPPREQELSGGMTD